MVERFTTVSLVAALDVYILTRLSRLDISGGHTGALQPKRECFTEDIKFSVVTQDLR